MREHGWDSDDWPAIFDVVLAGPLWSGDNSSEIKQVHEGLGGSYTC